MIANRLKKIIEDREKSKKDVAFNNDEIHNEKLIDFEFGGKKYYLALRDNVLIFAYDMTLIHTVTYEDIANSTVPLFVKAAEIVAHTRFAEDKDIYKIYIKRQKGDETLSFLTKFDALFIFRKLKRVAQRRGEIINGITLQKNDTVIDSFVPHKNEKNTASVNLYKGEGRHMEISDGPAVIEDLIDVEEKLEDYTASILYDMTSQTDVEKIDDCIKILQNIKNK